ncbi:type II toxin-antitoxin system HicB family antitoxin [Lactobacillus sp. ESL0684]|uniref:type II toxin-antitoxin system HicB family antitoxin n=1 Tax=Lactobacillus sp. ESL0684 TaxID=2983213 RepID=UPI0023F9C7D5|nr:type II toxin-antitoxin system HicB family antitoxin [Lactobacillus sp. ESL0684]WEV43551.1 type II toxin-antitoxin system HicB family antitoxin [Lactobacillus sp. ESL0684]
MQEKDLLTYPVIIWPAEKGYNVFVPDLGENGLATQGKDIDNAIYMVSDLIGCILSETTDYPKATPLEEVIVPDEVPNAIIRLASINIKDYRKQVTN